MHHTKEFAEYSLKKKTKLIVALIFKIAIFGTLFAGLFFLLRNYISPVLSFVFLHLILLACLVMFFYLQKHKNRISHNHSSEVE